MEDYASKGRFFTTQILMNSGFVSSPTLSPAVSIILRGRTQWTTPDTSWIVNNEGRPIEAAVKPESNVVAAGRRQSYLSTMSANGTSATSRDIRYCTALGA